MKRRKFIYATAAASTIPLGYSAAKSSNLNIADKELYEIRTYEMRFGGNANALLSYLNDALAPALRRKGVNHFMLFDEYGKDNPRNIWVLISYPDAATYLGAQDLQTDADFVKATAEYDDLPAERPIFNRYSSSLLHAFDGLPQMMDPIDGAALFELRIYEGYNEDAVRRKIKMFNVEEIPLFNKVGLYPVFFGEMIAGPHRPSLVYMLNFKDMEQRDANWNTFVNHPEWDVMRVKEEYANTVSNIRRVFLTPM